MAKHSALKVSILTGCGVLATALLILLGLILRQAVAPNPLDSSEKSVYDGFSMPEAPFCAVLLDDGDLDESRAPASVLKEAYALGVNAIVFDGSEENLSALLNAASERNEDEAVKVYRLWRLLSQDAIVSQDTADVLAGELQTFMQAHETLAGVVFADYTIQNTESLYDWYGEVSGEGFETFVSRIERELLTAVQASVKNAGESVSTGAVVQADSLGMAAISSASNDFLLLNASPSGETPSLEAAEAWVRYSGAEKPVCLFYTTPVTFSELEETQRLFAEANVCSEGYLVAGIPLKSAETEDEASSENSASDIVPETEKEASVSDETATSVSLESSELGSANSSVSSLQETEFLSPDPEEEPGIEGEETPDATALLTEAHEKTLQLLAGLTDPADVEPFYLPEDLLSDRLILNRPLSKNSSGTASALLFTGIVPLGSVVTLDGEPVELDQYGHFHYDVPLYVGANVIYLRVDDETYTFYYTRNVMNVSNYSPISSSVVDGGGELPVWVSARSGSVVTAELDGTVVTLTPQDDSYFPTYTGGIPLPDGNTEQTSLGNVTFRVTLNGETQVITGGAVTLNSTEQTLPERIVVRSQDSKYKDDGSATVYPVTPYGAHAPELLDLDAAADSNWEFSPLPDGTVDEVTGYAVYGGVEYYVLASGLRIAVSDTEPTDLTCSGNVISALTMINDGDFTHLVLDMTCPVVFQVECTAEEVRITFAHTASVPQDASFSKTPLFTAARWEDSTLVLPLRTEDGFLGYTARYEDNRLILSCTNPPVSGSVVGARIVVDPGHGGFDGEQADAGAIGAGMLDEAQINYYIGSYLADYLTELGAEPILTPSNTEYLTIEQRLDYASTHRASMNLSIHHNSSTLGSAYGVGTYYYQNYAEGLAALVQRETSDLHTANVSNGGDHDNGLYHTRYLFTLRTGWLSLMLEDGFVSNGFTYSQLIEPEFQASVARAVASAVATYYERFDAVAGWETGIERVEA